VPDRKVTIPDEFPAIIFDSQPRAIKSSNNYTIKMKVYHCGAT